MKVSRELKTESDTAKKKIEIRKRSKNFNVYEKVYRGETIYTAIKLNMKKY